DLVGKQPIVLLKTADGNKFLPIWIGHPEAAAILMKLQSQAAPRPMTHDLLSDMLEQLGAQIIRITVTELRENTFYAQITVQQDGTEIEVDSRPSDAIALAIRAEAPIFAADRVIEESAIEFEGEDVDQDQLEAEVAKQRLAEPAEHELFDDRRDDREERDVRCERGGVRGLPVRRRQPLLLARALRQGQDGDEDLEDVHEYNRADADPERPAPRAR